MKYITRCSHCGSTSRIQYEGNLCHSCSQGIMVKTKSEEIICISNPKGKGKMYIYDYE